ncbi:hypothetical protein [Microbulbifer elongatus]|uniref:hypothetical protein n=1 Tax=Microbulbifer elongatus TaxID=86173 RepID=UPI001CFE893E|nr:hypothetical protein [Microbulbifer elongatus]
MTTTLVTADLGISEWLTAAGMAADQTIVNALGDYLLEDPDEFLPSAEVENIRDHFLFGGYSFDWYDLLSGNAYSTVELNIDEIADACQAGTIMTADELGPFVLSFVGEWGWAVEQAFRKALKESVE